MYLGKMNVLACMCICVCVYIYIYIYINIYKRDEVTGEWRKLHNE
jgi:hypothetical protein